MPHAFCASCAFSRPSCDSFAPHLLHIGNVFRHLCSILQRARRPRSVPVGGGLNRAATIIAAVSKAQPLTMRVSTIADICGRIVTALVTPTGLEPVFSP